MNAIGRVTAVGVLLSCAGTGALCGQSRATSAIRGIVRLEDGTSLQGASVTVRHEQTGVVRTGLSNANGGFLILQLQPGGPYTLAVEQIGFATWRREGIELQVGETWTVEVAMQTRALELDELRVEVDRTAVFNPAQVGPATRLTERVLDVTPVLSRDIMELALLSPLVKTTESGGLSVAGQNDRYNACSWTGCPSRICSG